MPHSPVHEPVAEPVPDQLLSVSTLAGPHPGRVVVQVVGEVDGYTAPALDLCLQSQASQPQLRELVVHLGQVTFLGAAGIRVLAQAHHRCRMRGARLVIRTGGRPGVLRPLQLTGLADLVAVDPARPDRTQPRHRWTGRRSNPGRRRPPLASAPG
jgi:anti-anti-sigma factor